MTKIAIIGGTGLENPDILKESKKIKDKKPPKTKSKENCFSTKN